MNDILKFTQVKIIFKKTNEKIMKIQAHFLRLPCFIDYHVLCVEHARFPTPHNNNQHLFKYQLVHNKCMCVWCVRVWLFGISLAYI